jgi:hypothetical protein
VCVETTNSGFVRDRDWEGLIGRTELAGLRRFRIVHRLPFPGTMGGGGERRMVFIPL